MRISCTRGLAFETQSIEITNLANSIILVIALQQIRNGPVEQISKTQEMSKKIKEQLKNEEINDESSGSNYHQEKKKQKIKGIRNRGKVSRSWQRRRQRTRIKSEEWEYQQIHKIFTLYGTHGSQWKNMQGQFEQRSANSIKNRFYTVIRTFLKLLFRYHPGIINKLPHEIPSKTILKFFESREQFSKYEDFGKKTMRKLDYNINSSQLKSIVQQHQQQIQQIYNLIFKIKEAEENHNQEPPNKPIKQRPKDQNAEYKKIQLKQELNANNEYQDIAMEFSELKPLVQPKLQSHYHSDPTSAALTAPPQAYIIFIPYTNFCQNSTQINYFHHSA